MCKKWRHKREDSIQQTVIAYYGQRQWDRERSGRKGLEKVRRGLRRALYNLQKSSEVYLLRNKKL